ncbi:MAG TPA: flavin reductase family protein [Fibrobacteria bacterium]|jgi:flavin reductase (DIM6/NTAB) family NADH-FMN oxidoreductase RutF|nr:flavin reductase family protein [Fibrobacteria bacterium]
MKRSFPLSKVFRLLEPGPILLVSTRHKGRDNIQTIAWHAVLEFTPPTAGCVIAGEVTSQYLKATRECVLNIPTREIARKAVGCGTVSGRHVDKFARFGLTPVPAAKVGAPLIAECYANLECRVVDTRLARKHAFYVLEVVKAWVDPAVKRPRIIHHRGQGEFYEPGKIFRIPFRAGK